MPNGGKQGACSFLYSRAGPRRVRAALLAAAMTRGRACSVLALEDPAAPMQPNR
jgi:hypothetical protein